MSVNKFKILQPRLTDKEINLPIEMTWDFLDRSNDIEVYEEKVIKDVINQDKDFEVTRFSFVAPVGIEKSDINYEFNFVPAGATSTTTIWSPSYVVQGFTPKEIYYFGEGNIPQIGEYNTVPLFINKMKNYFNKKKPDILEIIGTNKSIEEFENNKLNNKYFV